MKIEKLPSGSYRVRKTINKKTHSFIFEAKPTKAMVDKKIAELTLNDRPASKSTFKSCAEQYIEVKSNVLSITTIKGYRSMLGSISEELLDMNVSDVTQYDIQYFINEYSQDHSAKTTHNIHGFISAVLAMFRPELIISTTLPQKRKEEPYIPTDSEVKRLLEYARDTKYYTPFCLGCMGLRLSEVCALTIDDLDENNILTINKATVRGDHELVTKTTKTVASVRKIKLPDALADRIREDGFVYQGYPDKVNENLTHYLERLGIKHFSFHKLRHYFASMAHNELGLSDSSICAMGGWQQNSSVMKSIYRHSMQDTMVEAQNEVANKMNGLF